MSMSEVALTRSEAAKSSNGAAVECASIIETAVTEIDAIDGLAFGQVNKALDHIRELLVKARRTIEAESVK